MKVNWNAFVRRHADVVVGLIAWFAVAQLVGRRVSPEWGIVTLVSSIAAGAVAYFLVQHFFPESRA